MIRILVIIISSIKIVNSQSDLPILIPFETNGKWGYMNEKKEIIVSPKFDEAFATFENLGRIKLNGKYGFIDRKGKLIVKAKLDSAPYYYSHLASVFHHNKWKLINQKGRNVKPKPGWICGIHSCNQNYNSRLIPNCIDSLGNYFMRFNLLQTKRDTTINFDSIYFKSNLFVFLVNNNKTRIAEWPFTNWWYEYYLDNSTLEYDEIIFFPCRNCIDGESNSKLTGIRVGKYFGFIDLDIPIRTITKPIYYSIKEFYKSTALVEFEPNKFGLIDYYGREYFIR